MRVRHRRGVWASLARRISIATTRMPLFASPSSMGALAVRSWSIPGAAVQVQQNGKGSRTLGLIDPGHQCPRRITPKFHIQDLISKRFAGS